MLFSLEENANIASENGQMVDLELDDGLAVLTIDRPHARNAISLDTMAELEKALDALDASADARALVIKGAGDKAFVSGGDLKELAAIRTTEEASAMAWRMRTICDRLARIPRSGDRRAERSRVRRRRRGGGRRRHPGGGRRHQDRLQPGVPGDHAGLGRRGAAGGAGRTRARLCCWQAPARFWMPPRRSASGWWTGWCPERRSTRAGRRSRGRWRTVRRAR